MFIIRQAKPHDLDDLHALAKQTYFINLPPDRDIIAGKIEQSAKSFASLAAGNARIRTERATDGGTKAGRNGKKNAGSAKAGSAGSKASGGAGIKALTGQSDLFLLVMEDVEGRTVVGTSQVIASMGGPGHPRVSLKLGQASRRSETLKLEWTHQIATLATDERGPSEIGGLILNHAFRGHKLRLGRFLSFVRFHLVGLYRERFADCIVAEMLGAIDRNGYSPFFEKFTRHFIPRSFDEVYRFSQTSKEFVTGLMPEYPLDLTIMDPEVAHAAGAVSEDTRPARRMLERLGFAYDGHVDPLDGGPHLEAATDEILPVRSTQAVKAIEAGAASDLRAAPEAILSTLDVLGEFRAVQTKATIKGGKAKVRKADVSHLRAEWVRAGATVLST